MNFGEINQFALLIKWLVILFIRTIFNFPKMAKLTMNHKTLVAPYDISKIETVIKIMEESQIII